MNCGCSIKYAKLMYQYLKRGGKPAAVRNHHSSKCHGHQSATRPTHSVPNGRVGWLYADRTRERCGGRWTPNAGRDSFFRTIRTRSADTPSTVGPVPRQYGRDNSWKIRDERRQLHHQGTTIAQPHVATAAARRSTQCGPMGGNCTQTASGVRRVFTVARPLHGCSTRAQEGVSNGCPAAWCY